MTNIKKKSAVKKKTAKKKTTVKAGSSKAVVRKKMPSKKSAAQSETSDKANEIGKPSKPGCLVLAPVLAINDVKKLHSDLNMLLNHDGDISIDASSVEMIDTAMIQLLVAFSEKTRSLNKALIWEHPSQPFINRADTLDVLDKLALENIDDR